MKALSEDLELFFDFIHWKESCFNLKISYYLLVSKSGVTMLCGIVVMIATYWKQLFSLINKKIFNHQNIHIWPMKNLYIDGDVWNFDKHIKRHTLLYSVLCTLHFTLLHVESGIVRSVTWWVNSVYACNS